MGERVREGEGDGEKARKSVLFFDPLVDTNVLVCFLSLCMQSMYAVY